MSVQRTTLAVLQPIWPVLVQGLTDSSTKHVADQLFQRNLIKVDEYEKIISSNVSSSYDRARILLGIAKHFPFEGCIEFALLLNETKGERALAEKILEQAGRYSNTLAFLRGTTSGINL